MFRCTISIHISHKRNDFRGNKKLFNIKCIVFPLQLFCETFLVPQQIQRDIITNVITFLHKALVILVGFYLKIMSSLDRFSKNTQLTNFVKINLLETELFNADGRTDVTKLTVAFASL